MKAFHGKHWGTHVHERIRPRFQQFGDIFLSKVLPPFDRVNDEAHSLEERRLEELTSSLVCADEDRWDGEQAMAEIAFDEAMDYAVTFTSMRFATLNLFSAALFHLTEQHLVDLCLQIVGHNAQTEVHRHEATGWLKDVVGADVKSLPSWPVLTELGLVANTVKHAEGRSAQELRTLNPRLFAYPGLEDRYITKRRLRTPLFGDELFVTREDFERYHQGTVTFWTELGDELSKLTR